MVEVKAYNNEIDTGTSFGRYAMKIFVSYFFNMIYWNYCLSCKLAYSKDSWLNSH